MPFFISAMVILLVWLAFHMIETLGLVAACFTTIAFVPQAWKTVKTGDTRSISLPMYVLFMSGLFLWLIYGIQLNLLPVILSNIFTIAFASIVLFYKVREVLRNN